MSVIAAEIHCKTIGEIRKYDMDFADDLSTGDSLTGTPTVVEESTSDLTIDQETISGTVAQCRVAGGVDGVEYLLRYTVTTTNGDTLETLGRLVVEDG